MNFFTQLNAVSEFGYCALVAFPSQVYSAFKSARLIGGLTAAIAAASRYRVAFGFRLKAKDQWAMSVAFLRSMVRDHPHPVNRASHGTNN
jgi:hypothetical protein